MNKINEKKNTFCRLSYGGFINSFAPKAITVAATTTRAVASKVYLDTFFISDCGLVVSLRGPLLHVEPKCNVIDSHL